MKDRYLYRAKRTDNGEWVEGYLITDEQNQEKCFIGYVFGTNDDGTPHDFDVVAVDSSTICQCTGLRDKNGKLIWENDIAECIDDGNVFTYVVIWDKSELDFKATNGKEKYKGNFVYLTCCEEIKVIGNIFDHKELLEVGE